MRLSLPVLLVCATPALAEVSSDALWADWQRLAGQAGNRLSAAEVREGDRLILNQPALQFTSDGRISELRLDQVVLQDNVDGTVSVILPERFDVVVDVPVLLPDMASEVIVFSAWAPGLDVRVSGWGDDAAFAVLAPAISLIFDPDRSKTVGDTAASVSFALADLNLTHSQTISQDWVNLTSAMTLGTFHTDALISQPGGDRIEISADLSGIAGTIDVDLDEVDSRATEATMAELFSRLAADKGGEVTFRHGPVALSLRLVDDAPGPSDVQLSSASGQALVRVDETGLALSVGSGRTALVAQIDDPTIPVSAVDLSYADLGFDFRIEVTGPEDPLGFDLGARLSRLAASEAIWTAADPEGIFPRDPMSFSLAMSGLMAEFPDLAGAVMGQTPPVEVLAFALDELLLSGLGVELTGSGDLTFDPADRVTFDGLPAPEGILTFSATGLNALIDRFVASGLVPMTDLTGLRLGLAFIAKPGEGTDVLSTRIEFRDKALYLNGIKIR